VLTVPNAALRFRPTAEMLAAAGLGDGAATARRRGDSATPAAGDSARRVRVPRAAGDATGGPRNGVGGTGAGRTAMGQMGQLWYLDPQGKPAMVRVRTGLTDGQRTEISAATLREGMQVIVGAAQAGTAPAASGTGSPFQQQRQGGPRPPGGF
jgi:HlyD family secretion protein